MITNKKITKAVGARALKAMQLAGYDSPRLQSIETDKPERPCCMVLVDTENATVECGGYAERAFAASILFVPEDVQRPYSELRDMDDCMVRAFLSALPCDGYQLLPDKVRAKIDTENEVLMTTVEYTIPIAAEELEIGETDDAELMETLDLE